MLVGQLSVKIEGPDGNDTDFDLVPVDLNRFSVKFVPRLEGEMYSSKLIDGLISQKSGWSVCWSDQQPTSQSHINQP